MLCGSCLMCVVCGVCLVVCDACYSFVRAACCLGCLLFARWWLMFLVAVRVCSLFACVLRVWCVWC